jgi:hypothetical protein
LSGGAAAEKPRVRATSSTSEGDPCGALNAELDSAPRSAPAPPRMRRSAEDMATEGTRFARTAQDFSVASQTRSAPNCVTALRGPSVLRAAVVGARCHRRRSPFARNRVRGASLSRAMAPHLIAARDRTAEFMAVAERLRSQARPARGCSSALA